MTNTSAAVRGTRASLSPDPLAQLAPDNLVSTYARLREAAPVHWSRYFGGWVLTRHADALSVLSDPAFLADDPIARFDLLERRGGPSLPNLRTVLSNVAFFTNPPRHVTLRKFMSRLSRARKWLEFAPGSSGAPLAFCLRCRAPGRKTRLGGRFWTRLGHFYYPDPARPAIGRLSRPGRDCPRGSLDL